MTGPTPKLRSLDSLPGPSGWPLLGNLLEVDLARLHSVLERWCAQYGELYTFRLGPQRFLSVGDAELCRRIFQDRPDDFRRMHTMESVARELDMHGVFSAEGADWQRQRKLIMPAFKDENLANAFAVLQRITQRLVEHLRKLARTGEPVDVLHHLMRYTVDVMAAVAFGRDMNTLERGPDELQRDFETIFPMLLRRVNAPFAYWHYLKLPADRRLDRALAHAREILTPLIDGTRAQLAREPQRAQKPATLLEAMVVAASDDESNAPRLSDEEVLANVVTLLLAGEDTTANTLAWLFYYIAGEPEVQRELQREADGVLGSASVLPRHTQASELRYLGAATHETLRLKSPAPFVSLEAVRDVVIGDVQVPAGTPVFLLTRHFALQEGNFPQPQRFDPQRWLGGPGAPERTHLARASLPFGAGPRICPGRQLALLECSLVGSAIAKSFELSLPEGLTVSERFDFAMEPEGLRVVLRERRATQTAQSV